MIFSKNYFYAIAILVGTIIGAGIFALPILVSASGILPFLLILGILIGVQYLFHEMYAYVILSTKGEHRIPGYVEIYFGKKYKKLASLVALAGGYGGLLAYVILGGIFSHALFSPLWGGSILTYSLLIFSLEAIVVLFGLKVISKVELFMTILLLIVAVLVSWKCFNNARIDNFIVANWKYAFLLYGPVFFSVGGDAAIPEVCKLLEKDKRKIKSAILWGTLIAGAITGLFVVAVVGATGGQTTPDTLSGLQKVLDGKIIFLALAFGLINIMTSFFTGLQALREIYWWDFKMNKYWAWALAAALPLLLFLLGVQNITSVVSLTGAVTGGALGVIVIALFRRASAKPQIKNSPLKLSLPKLFSFALSAMFILGLCYEVWAIFF